MNFLKIPALRYFSDLLQLRHDLGNRLLGITEEHETIGIAEQFVLNSCITLTHGTLTDDDRPCLVSIEDGHAIDRAVRISPRGRITFRHKN